MIHRILSARSSHDAIVTLRWRQALLSAGLLFLLSMMFVANVERKLADREAMSAAAISKSVLPAGKHGAAHGAADERGDIDELSDLVPAATAGAKIAESTTDKSSRPGRPRANPVRTE